MLLNGSVNGMIPLLIKRIINTIAAIPTTKRIVNLPKLLRPRAWSLL